jgi:hypothetical protein
MLLIGAQEGFAVWGLPGCLSLLKINSVWKSLQLASVNGTFD